MEDKFDRMPKGSHQNESLKSYTPGSDSFNQPYLKNFDCESCERGYNNVADDEKEMERTSGKIPRLMGEY